MKPSLQGANVPYFCLPAIFIGGYDVQLAS